MTSPDERPKRAYRVYLARRGENEVATVPAAVYDDEGHRVKGEWEDRELTQRVVARSREKAIKRCRRRIPTYLKPIMVKRLDEED